MKTILDYRVIEENTRLGLITEVNRAIQDGWQPLGGVAVDVDGCRYYQAVVNYEEK